MIKGVLLSVADCQRDAGASVGAWLRHNFPPLNLEAVCLVACYSYDGGPHWGADVRRPSLGSKDETASQELVQSALRSSVAENLKGMWWLPTASVCIQ